MTGAAAGGSFAAAFFSGPAPGATTATLCPTVTVSPSLAKISSTVPLVGVLTSIVTLSVSICAITSSVATVCPTATSTVATAPSVIESPIEGTSTLAGGPPLAAAGFPAAAAAVFFALPLSLPIANAMTLCPTETVSPGFASTRVTLPALGARTSMVTLSVSICATTSSVTTSSPTFFITVEIVPSVIESPIDGTTTVDSSTAAEEDLLDFERRVNRKSGLFFSSSKSFTTRVVVVCFASERTNRERKARQCHNHESRRVRFPRRGGDAQSNQLFWKIHHELRSTILNSNPSSSPPSSLYTDARSKRRRRREREKRVTDDARTVAYARPRTEEDDDDEDAFAFCHLKKERLSTTRATVSIVEPPLPLP